MATTVPCTLSSAPGTMSPWCWCQREGLLACPRDQPCVSLLLYETGSFLLTLSNMKGSQATITLSVPVWSVVAAEFLYSFFTFAMKIR